MLPLIRRVRPEGGGFAVVPLIRGIPPEGGRGFVFLGSRPASLSGRKPAPLRGASLIPPCQGGKSSPPDKGEYRRGRGLFFFGSRPASLSGRKPAPLRGASLIPPCQGGKSSPPEGGRGFVFGVVLRWGDGCRGVFINTVTTLYLIQTYLDGCRNRNRRKR